MAASHPLASQAGVRILQKGGNAVDASVAVAAALQVVEPLMSGIGGDGFIMVYMRADDTVKVVNGTGSAPYAATRERYLPEGIPLKGVLSTSVPGLLRSWTEAHERYGLLSLSELKGHQRDRKGFEKRLKETWNCPLDLLDLLIAMTVEGGLYPDPVFT